MTELITDIIIEGINTKDYPDFSDAYIYAAKVSGRPMTEEELEKMSEDRNFVAAAIIDWVYK